MTPRELTVDLEAVTPLFLGGANQDEPEARAASFRGALRFWWRALAAEPDLAKLRAREAAVFGDTSRASAVRVDVEPVKQAPVDWQAATRLPSGRLPEQEQIGLNYLGFALAQRRSTRHGLPVGSNVRLTLRLRRGADEDALRQAVAALWLLVNLGGIGTRARRGFGSLAVTSTAQLGGLPPWHHAGERPGHAVRHLQDGLAQIGGVVERAAPVDRPVEYPVLMRRHCWLVALQLESPSWQAALGAIGRLLAAFRKSLYPQLADLRTGGTTDRAPERAAFGLPIQYFRPSIGQRPSESYTLIPIEAGIDGTLSRRASPLHIKIVSHSQQRFGVLLTVFQDFGPGFLPSSVTALRGGGLTVEALPSAKPLADFLTRLADPTQEAGPEWPGSPGLIQVAVP